MNEDQKNKEAVSPERNDIEVTNPRREGVPPVPARPSDPAEERRADLTTAANQEIAEAHGDEAKDGDTATRLEQIAGPAGSVDEHMPAGSESPEDTVNDIINSGILKL